MMDWERELGDIMNNMPGPGPQDNVGLGMTLPMAMEQADRIHRACPWLQVAVLGQGADFMYHIVACTVRRKKKNEHGPIRLTNGYLLTAFYQIWNPLHVDTLIANSYMPLGFVPPEVEAREKPQDGREQTDEG